MQVQFNGCRIERAEQYNGKFYTIVGVPAVDSFSHPSKYRLQSSMMLGHPGTFIDVTCNMQGLVKQKNYFDKQTGQQRTYDDSAVMFEVVGFQPHQKPVTYQQPAGSAIPDAVQLAGKK